jgi:hypothetical protein
VLRTEHKGELGARDVAFGKAVSDAELCANSSRSGRRCAMFLQPWGLDIAMTCSHVQRGETLAGDSAQPRLQA